MSKAIKELERKKREEERRKLMQKYYAPPTTPPYAPPLFPPMKKGSSNPIPADVEKIFSVAMEDERGSLRRYTSLAKILHSLGFTKEEYEVSNIMLDEQEHLNKLKDILERLKYK